jgi:hypothetical protein
VLNERETGAAGRGEEGRRDGREARKTGKRRIEITQERFALVCGAALKSIKYMSASKFINCFLRRPPADSGSAFFARS